jgi:hypothetical protein
MAEVHDLPGDAVGVEIALEEVEVALLLSLAAQMAEFVAPRPLESEDPLAALVGIDPSAQMSDDPALQRLLPDAYADDPDASAQFRRFTERDLREAKVRNALSVTEQLAGSPSSVVVTGDAIPPWLGFLNDTRLTLGTRLELSEDNHDELADLPESDPRAGLFQVYDWLTFLQESIVQRLLPSA